MNNIVDKHSAIKEVDLQGNILTIHASMQMRRFIKEDKNFLDTQRLLGLIKGEYEVIEILSESKISNWEKSGFTRQGTWVFKIKKPRKPRKTNKKENTGPATSFRGRISKIAKQKQESND